MYTIDKWAEEQFRQYARDWLNGDASRYDGTNYPPVRNAIIDREIDQERQAYKALRDKRGA